jgi:hypothetical protein
MARIAPPLRWPWNLAIIATAGFPGISLGSRKLIVSAAQRVTRKNPDLLMK